MAATRNQLLARLHCIKKEQGWDDDTYRDILATRTGKRSAADLDGPALARLVAALGAQTDNRKRTEWSFVFAASGERQPLLKKLYRIAQSWGKSKAYLEGIAQQMIGGETRLEFCAPETLRGLVAACEAQRKREGARNAS